MARLDVVETFHGLFFPGHLHTQDSLQLALKFPFQDTDIIIVSYPKSGTTWMQEIVTLISSRGDPHVSRSVPNWARAPWLEHHYFAALLEASPTTPRVITTHLPHHLLGPTLQGSKAKVIYVSRNPKDVVVSFYHFHKIAKFLPEAGSFSEFLNRFLKVHYGCWFDHIEGWTRQKATMNNLYLLTLLPNHNNWNRSRRNVHDDEVNNCVKHCSFSSMKDNKMANYTLVTEEIMDHKKGFFMRKGKIGDWKNMFTEELNQYFNSVLESKMVDSTLEFTWDEQHEEETHANKSH
uniref:Sulfotransferase n=1 Tax=Cyclopterus lumpus TaxID=8103 RepID=A0A8C2YX10_CYCLU